EDDDDDGPKDSDGDGAEDDFERRVGTDPNDAADVPLARGSGLTFGCGSVASSDGLLLSLAICLLLLGPRRRRGAGGGNGRSAAGLLVFALVLLGLPQPVQAQHGFNARTFHPGAMGR